MIIQPIIQKKNNPTESNIVKEFECEYFPERSLWWYTRHSFVFRLLNKSLRTQNIELLYLFGFYIRDLEKELKINQCLSPIHVYRAQLMSKDEIEILKNSIGDFISINSFLSTSLNRNLAIRRFSIILNEFFSKLMLIHN